MRKLIVCIVVCLFLASSISAPLRAEENQEKGKLEKFEEKLDEPKPKPAETHDDRDHEHHHHHDHEDYHERDHVSGTEIATQGMMEMIMSFLLTGYMQSPDQKMGDVYRELKESQSPALPTIRFEPAYQYIFDSIHGFSGKVEAGYLTFGADVEYSRYFEKNAHDLSFVNGHFLIRSLLARIIGVNLALGVKSIFGKTNHVGFEMGMPFYAFINEHFIFDVLPYMAFVNNNNVYDIAGGLSYKYKLVGVRAAYRAIFVRDETIHGPQIGFFFQW